MRIIGTQSITYLTIFLLSITLIGCTSVKYEPFNVLPAPRHGGVYVVAHRGAHIGIPENTLAAYEAAIEMGVDFVEVDLVQRRMVTLSAYTTKRSMLT